MVVAEQLSAASYAINDQSPRFEEIADMFWRPTDRSDSEGHYFVRRNKSGRAEYCRSLISPMSVALSSHSVHLTLDHRPAIILEFRPTEVVSAAELLLGGGDRRPLGIALRRVRRSS